MQYIVTHAGQAHSDELIAIALALHIHGPMSIHRREPLESELRDPAIIILDVGMRHEPELNNFDHHQLSPEDPPECAYSLFAKGYGLEKCLSYNTWYEAGISIDTKGPYATAAKLNLPRFPFELQSPLISALTDTFSKQKLFHRDHWIVQALYFLGRSILNESSDLAAKIEDFYRIAKPIQIDSISAILVEDKEITGIENYRKETCPEAAVSICHDDRGNGWTLYRFEDHPSIDFRQIKDKEEILFSHNNGFIAKTKERLPLEQVIELVRASIVKKEN